jgi:hypothetical protein
MRRHIPWLALIVLALPAIAHAELVRFHYAPMDACNTMTQVSAGPDGALGELRRGYGVRSLPYPYVVRPNQMVTFRHAFNGKPVTIPMRFPAGQQASRTAPIASSIALPNTPSKPSFSPMVPSMSFITAAS